MKGHAVLKKYNSKYFEILVFVIIMIIILIIL